MRAQKQRAEARCTRWTAASRARSACCEMRLLELEALLAYEIDFPEEDDGPIPPERIDRALDRSAATGRGPAWAVRLGELVREGAVVVLAGPPNAGKSSLFNALLGVERAIVHETPGTTRDAIEAVIEVNRWPLRLVDTAGLRESDDEIERTGVEVSRRYLAGAHVVLVCARERGRTLAEHHKSFKAPLTRRRSPVLTKSDLKSAHERGNGSTTASERAPPRRDLSSCLERIERRLDATYGSLDPDLPLLTRARHQSALNAAAKELAAFRELRVDEFDSSFDCRGSPSLSSACTGNARWRGRCRGRPGARVLDVLRRQVAAISSQNERSGGCGGRRFRDVNDFVCCRPDSPRRTVHLERR